MRVEGFQDGPVPEAQRLVDVGLVDDLLGFAGRQDALGQAVFQPGQFDVAAGL